MGLKYTQTLKMIQWHSSVEICPQWSHQGSFGSGHFTGWNGLKWPGLLFTNWNYCFEEVRGMVLRYHLSLPLLIRLEVIWILVLSQCSPCTIDLTASRLETDTHESLSSWHYKRGEEMRSDIVQGIILILDIPPNTCKSIEIGGEGLLEGVDAMTNETSYHLLKLAWE